MISLRKTEKDQERPSKSQAEREKWDKTMKNERTRTEMSANRKSSNNYRNERTFIAVHAAKSNKMCDGSNDNISCSVREHR